MWFLKTCWWTAGMSCRFAIVTTPFCVVFINDVLDLVLKRVLAMSPINTFVADTLRLRLSWGAVSIENVTFHKAVR